MRTSRLACLLLVLFLVGLGVTSPVTAAAPVQVEVPIGLSVYLTGPLSSMGINAQRGAQLAVEKINAQGIRVGNTEYKLKLIVDDNAFQANKAVAVVNKHLYTDKVKILSTLGTTPSIAVAPLVDGEQVLAFTLSSLAEQISPRHPRTFRTYQSAIEYAGPFIAWVGKNHPQIKSVYTIIPDTGTDVPIAALFKKAFDYYGIKYLGQRVYPPTVVEFSSIIDAALAEKPDAILVGTTAGNVTKQLREKGFAGQILVEAVIDASQMKLGGNALDGSLGINPDPTSSRLPKGIAQYMADYQAKYGEPPLAVATDTYVQFSVLASAIAIAGSADVDKLVKVMETQELDSPWGKIRFGGKEFYGVDHQAYLPTFITAVKGGKFSVVSVVSPAEALANNKLIYAK